MVSGLVNQSFLGAHNVATTITDMADRHHVVRYAHHYKRSTHHAMSQLIDTYIQGSISMLASSSYLVTTVGHLDMRFPVFYNGIGHSLTGNLTFCMTTQSVTDESHEAIAIWHVNHPKRILVFVATSYFAYRCISHSLHLHLSVWVLNMRLYQGAF